MSTQSTSGESSIDDEQSFESEANDLLESLSDRFGEHSRIFKHDGHKKLILVPSFNAPDGGSVILSGVDKAKIKHHDFKHTMTTTGDRGVGVKIWVVKDE